MSIDDFINGIPKAELHLHIEGTFEPELMFRIAGRNNVRIKYRSVDEIRDAYRFDNLQDFLDIYYEGAGIMNYLAAELTRYQAEKSFLIFVTQ